MAAPAAMVTRWTAVNQGPPPQPEPVLNAIDNTAASDTAGLNRQFPAYQG